MLQDYVAKGSNDIGMIATLVGQVIESKAWSEFTDQLGNRVTHDSFQSFVTTPHWRGLGTSKQALVGWVREQDESVAEAVERAWKEEVPARGNPSGGRPKGENRCATTVNPMEADGILARLKRDDDALAQQVINGEITANAAARLKGWRKPRILLTSPESIASALCKHLSVDEVQKVKELLP